MFQIGFLFEKNQYLKREDIPPSSIARAETLPNDLRRTHPYSDWNRVGQPPRAAARLIEWNLVPTWMALRNGGGPWELWPLAFQRRCRTDRR